MSTPTSSSSDSEIEWEMLDSYQWDQLWRQYRVVVVLDEVQFTFGSDHFEILTRIYDDFQVYRCYWRNKRSEATIWIRCSDNTRQDFNYVMRLMRPRIEAIKDAIRGWQDS